MATVTGDTPTSIDLINLVIALFALAAALGALGWQVAAHFLTGGRVKLEPVHGLAHESGRDMFTLPSPNAMPTTTIETFRGEGYTNRVVGVNVRNVGRLPVTVDAVSVVIQPSGVVYKPLNAALGPPLSHRVEAGSSEQWAVEAWIIWASAIPKNTNGRGGESFVIRVGLGNGKVHETPPQRIPERPSPGERTGQT